MCVSKYTFLVETIFILRGRNPKHELKNVLVEHLKFYIKIMESSFMYTHFRLLNTFLKRFHIKKKFYNP